jgi:hypothetical protein
VCRLEVMDPNDSCVALGPGSRMMGPSAVPTVYRLFAIRLSSSNPDLSTQGNLRANVQYDGHEPCKFSVT